MESVVKLVFVHKSISKGATIYRRENNTTYFKLPEIFRQYICHYQCVTYFESLLIAFEVTYPM